MRMSTTNRVKTAITYRDIPPSTIKKEVKKEPVKTTEKEEYQQRLAVQRAGNG
jgi:hypothetical protein